MKKSILTLDNVLKSCTSKNDLSDKFKAILNILEKQPNTYEQSIYKLKIFIKYLEKIDNEHFKNKKSSLGEQIDKVQKQILKDKTLGSYKKITIALYINFIYLLLSLFTGIKNISFLGALGGISGLLYLFSIFPIIYIFICAIKYNKNFILTASITYMLIYFILISTILSRAMSI